MKKYSVSIPLTEEQAIHLKEIREEFSLYQLQSALDTIFYYSLDGMGNQSHAEDATSDFRALAKTKQLLAMLMQPGIEIPKPA